MIILNLNIWICYSKSIYFFIFTKSKANKLCFALQHVIFIWNISFYSVIISDVNDSVLYTFLFMPRSLIIDYDDHSISLNSSIFSFHFSLFYFLFMRDHEFSSNLSVRICGKCPRILFESRAFEEPKKIFWNSVLGSFKDLGSWKKYVVRRKIASTEKHYADLENILKVSLYDLGYLSRIVHFMISYIICESLKFLCLYLYIFFLFFFSYCNNHCYSLGRNEKWTRNEYFCHKLIIFMKIWV